MCGICGIAFANGSTVPHREMLTLMAESLRHRGPDSAGYFEAPGAGFGFRRLSIIDLATGEQPITSEDGRVTVVCNGEIYNFIELREQLETKGHRFRTRSDSEVIIHLYEDHGTECLGFLRGMFGFALWDSPRRQLILARDRLGIKPLHYALTPEAIYFGSEQKSILASAGKFDCEIDVHAVRDLLSLGYVAGARTLCRGIRRLLPGHFALYRNGKFSTHSYWRPEFPIESGVNERFTAAEWAEALREKLDETVRMHMRSDVAVGAWLSSGIDSSAVVALASRSTTRPIQTVTIGFDDPTLDETTRFPTLNKFPGFSIANDVVRCGSNDFDKFAEALWHCEEPTHVMIPRLILGKAASKHVKVVLTGEGADEVLGGYHWYKHDKALRPLALLPREMRRLMLPVLQRIPRWSAPMSRLHLAPLPMNLERYLAIHSTMAGLLDEALLSEEFHMQLKDDLELPITPPAEFQKWSPFEQLQYLDFTIRLPEFVNHALDRASMAFGVEVRVPFLDHTLVEFLSHVPPKVKMRGFLEKYVLREAMRGVLPEEVRTRRKHAMSAPFQQWWRGPLPEFAADALSHRKLLEKGYFQPGFVHELLDRQRRGVGAYAYHLTAVLAVQIWHETLLPHRMTSITRVS